MGLAVTGFGSRMIIFNEIPVRGQNYIGTDLMVGVAL